MKNNQTDMKRRDFLAKICAASGVVVFHPSHLLGEEPSVNDGVEKVLVIFKTHLDVGFTDMAATVMNTYFEHFIPNVMSLTEKMERQHEQDRYIWTTGSWLIYRYLEEASPENRRRMERAVEAGNFVWLGVPFSMECELLDRSLFRLGMAYSDRLDHSI
jgi:hypothetical protein